MKASEANEKREQPPLKPPLATKREWLQLLACGVVIVLLCVIWTFWA